MNSEIIEAEAVPIDDQIERATRGFGALRAKVSAKLADYEGATVTDVDSYKAVKRYRADVNALRKEIDDSRKAVKRAYTARLDDFEGEVKAIKTPLDDADARMGQMVSEWEQRKRNDRHDMLSAAYAETYPTLAEQVPFARIDALHTSGRESWYAATVGDKKALSMLAAHVDEIAKAEQTIDNLDMTDAERVATKVDLFDSLSLQDALDAARRRREEAAEREARERQVAEMEQARFEAALAEQQAQAAPAPEPESVPEPAAPAAPVSTQRDMLRDYAGATTWIATVEATKDEIGALAAYLSQHGLHGGITPTGVALRDFQAQELRAEAVRLAPRMAQLREIKREA